MPTLLAADRVRTADGVVGDAVLIDDGAVLAVGTFDELARPEIPIVRFPGATLAPGFRDAHIHPVWYAETRSGLVLDGVTSHRELASIVAEAADDLPSGAALIAGRLDEERFDKPVLPNRTLLDVTDHPVLLHRVCGHIAVANTAALDLAGVGPDTPDPPGGSFDRLDGTPTGVLRETAVRVVARTVERHRPPLNADDLLRGLTELRATGITSVGAMVSTDSGPWEAGSEAAALLEVAGDLPLRVHVFLMGDPKRVAELAPRFNQCRLRFAGVKDFADGSLGGHTAALSQPYDDTAAKGTVRLDERRVDELTALAGRFDGTVALHAIGDRAVSMVLDVFERLIGDGWGPSRLRVEHASVLSDALIARMAGLGVVGSVQPAFVRSDGPWLPARLGADRIAYRFRSMRDAGIPLIGGSDSPVERPDPLFGLAAARDRQGYHPEEELDPLTALALFTSAAATALREPAPLEPGSPADLVALDVDPVVVSPDALERARVLETWVGGESQGLPAT